MNNMYIFHKFVYKPPKPFFEIKLVIGQDVPNLLSAYSTSSDMLLPQLHHWFWKNVHHTILKHPHFEVNVDHVY